MMLEAPQLRVPKHLKTDNFLTSVERENATGYHLSLNLELLRGCQFSCKGCFVDKYGADPMNDEWGAQLLSWVTSAEQQGSYLPTVIFIGPTDFLSANNTIEVLQDPRIRQVVSRFKRLSLQTTCLDITAAPKIAEVLREHYGHMELEVNFLMEPEHVLTEKYLRTVKENRDSLYEIIDWHIPVKSFCIMNVYEYERVKKEDVSKLLNDYKEMHLRIKEMFDTTIDFNFSMSRKHNQNKSDEVKQAIIRVTKMFDKSVNHDTSQFIRFSFGRLTDSLIEKHYNFLNGKFYVSPLLYDRYAAFVPELQVPFIDYTVVESEAFEEKLQLEQYQNANKKDECGNCRYLGSCVDRNILKIMDIYNIKSCIIARDALDAINTRPY
jgi:hypothetical protein